MFGRSITTIDPAQHAVIKQWRLLVPIRTWTYQLAQYTAVTLAFVRGDSDTADRYPIALKGNAVAPLALCSPTSFGRLVKGSGLVVKTRAGLTTFGEGLTDDEVRYLHALVRRALAGTTG